MPLEQAYNDLLVELVGFFRKHDIGYVIIGAMVPQLLIDMREKNGKGYGIRKSFDVDCAVQAQNWNDYYSIIDKLRSRGFERRKCEPAHRLFFKGTAVDIIPYGEEIAKGDELIWPENGHRMSMAGLNLLFKNAHQLQISKSLKISVPPLPLAVYSKLLTFFDRKASKDLSDVLYMLSHYEEGTVSHRRADSGIPSDLEFEWRGAFLAGQELTSYDIPDNFSDAIEEGIFESEPELRESCRTISIKEEDGRNLVNSFIRGMKTV